ncbi:hypothetical protein [Yinghuangia sp. YIM S09857]|uniref:hypothetical protein n=1 Tax=Yinghuangia sp. YIM S09857 TaxID=3436929 RepID=UPI003F52D322
MSTYDIDELRQAMADGADGAPDALGVLAAAHEAAARRRRRRRTYQATAVVAALAAVAVAVPTTLDAWVDGGPTKDSGPAADAANGLGVQLTLRPNDRSNAMLIAAGTTTQHMEIRGNGSSPNGRPSGTATLYAPGAFDPSQVLTGERVTVNGHLAYYLPGGAPVVPTGHPDTPEGARSVAGQITTDPLVAWEAAPGHWVTVRAFFSEPVEEVLWLAGLVEVEAPTLPPSPFYLGYLPADLVAQGTLTHGTRASLAFGTAARPLGGNWGSLGMPDFNETLLIDAMAVTPETLPGYQARMAQAGPPTKLGPYDAWYTTEAETDPPPTSTAMPRDMVEVPFARTLPNSATPGEGASLTIMTPNCHVEFSVADKNLIPRAELEKIALATDFKDCTNPTTWVRPLP